MACEDCLEVCFVGLVVERICIWCLVIVAIFMGFGQAAAKRCGDSQNSSIGGCDASHKRGAFFIGKAGSHCVIYICCIVKLHYKSYWVYTVKDFIEYLFSLYYCCFTCLRLAKPNVQLKVS